MNLLLDTHVLIWWMSDSAKLSREVRAAIANEGNTVFVSAVSFWEISIKEQLGKISVPKNFKDKVEDEGFLELPVTWEHAHATRGLKPIHKDPFDRMLVAQALREKLVLATRDAMISKYRVKVLW